MFSIRGVAAALPALAALASVQSQAATVIDCGPNVCYQYSDTQIAIGETGLPVRVGDSMIFLPPTFRAESTGAATEWDTATANFIFSRVWTTDVLNEIVSFTVDEEFDYRITNGGQVQAALYLQARSLVVATDGTSINANLPTISGDTGGQQVGNLSASVNPAAAFTGVANDMTIGIQNTLDAYTSAAGQNAWIQKKFTLVTQTLNPVPVPGAIWLLGSSLGLLGWIRRRAAAKN